MRRSACFGSKPSRWFIHSWPEYKAMESECPDAIRAGVSLGPDGNDRPSVCPVARIFSEVPPMSTTSALLIVERVAATSVIKDLRVISAPSCRMVARLRLAANDDLTVISSSLEHGGLGFDRAHSAGHQHAPSAFVSVRSSAQRLLWSVVSDRPLTSC